MRRPLGDIEPMQGKETNLLVDDELAESSRNPLPRLFSGGFVGFPHESAAVLHAVQGIGV